MKAGYHNGRNVITIIKMGTIVNSVNNILSLLIVCSTAIMENCLSENDNEFERIQVFQTEKEIQ